MPGLSSLGGFGEIIADVGPLEKVVLVVLLAMSVISWAIILHKALQFRMVTGRERALPQDLSRVAPLLARGLRRQAPPPEPARSRLSRRVPGALGERRAAAGRDGRAPRAGRGGHLAGSAGLGPARDAPRALERGRADGALPRVPRDDGELRPLRRPPRDGRRHHELVPGHRHAGLGEPGGRRARHLGRSRRHRGRPRRGDSRPSSATTTSSGRVRHWTTEMDNFALELANLVERRLVRSTKPF